MMERLLAALQQLISFVVVGGLAFVVVGGLAFVADAGGFNVLRYAGPDGHGIMYDQAVTAKLVSTALGVLVAWLGNRYWTLKDTRREQVHHEVLIFLAVSAVGGLIAMGCLGFSHYVLGLTSKLADNISANGVGLVLATLFRFWGYKTLVFVAGKPAEDVEVEAIDAPPAA